MKILFLGESSYFSYKLIENISKINSVSFKFCTPKKFPKNNPLINYPVKNTSRIWTNYLFPFQLVKEARKFNPDIIHIQFEFHGLLGFCSTSETVLLPVMLLFFKLLKFKTVITLHSAFSKQSFKENFKSLRLKTPYFILYSLLKTYTKILARFSNLLIVYTNSILDTMHNDFKIPLSKLCIIDYGVEVKEPLIDPRIYKMYSEKFKELDVILFFGVLSPRKGIEVLLEAFSKIRKKYKNLVLVIGGGESKNYKGYNKELVSLCQKLKIEENVIFTGTLQDDEIHSLFKLAKIAVFPYKRSIISAAMTWAMQHKTPVIATRTPAFTENFEDGKEIILIDVDDIESLSNTISLLVDNEDLRRNLSEGLYQRALLSSWDIVTQKHLKTFAKLIN